MSHAHCNYLYKCIEYGTHRQNFRAILRPKINLKKINFGLFSRNVFSGFTSVLLYLLSPGLTSVLVYMSKWATFKGVLNIGLRGLNFGHLGPRRYHNSDIQSFSQIFPNGWHHSCFTCSFRYFQVYFSDVRQRTYPSTRVNVATEIVRRAPYHFNEIRGNYQHIPKSRHPYLCGVYITLWMLLKYFWCSKFASQMIHSSTSAGNLC